jgi:hypothetical protein
VGTHNLYFITNRLGETAKFQTEAWLLKCQPPHGRQSGDATAHANENTLLQTYPDDFSTLAEAKAEQEFLFAFLESPWGYRRCFYDVFGWSRNP